MASLFEFQRKRFSPRILAICSLDISLFTFFTRNSIIVISVEVSDFAAVAGAKIAVQSTGMVSDAVILEAVDMTKIVTQANTALGNYTKPGA